MPSQPSPLPATPSAPDRCDRRPRRGPRQGLNRRPAGPGRAGWLIRVMVALSIPVLSCGDSVFAARSAILADLGGPTAPATALAGAPGALFVAHDTEVRVYDVSEPDRPRPIETTPAIRLAAPAARLVSGGRWLLAADTAGGLTVVDVAAPAAPVVAGRLVVGVRVARDIVIDAEGGAVDRALVLDELGALHVVALAIGTAPREIGTFHASRALDHVTVEGDRLYATAMDWPTVLYGAVSLVLVTLDWRDPSAPRELGATAIITSYGYNLYTARGIRTAGGKVVVAYDASLPAPLGGAWYGGLFVVDATDPHAARVEADFSVDGAGEWLPSSALDDFGRVRDEAGVAFLTGYQALMRVDFDDPMHPVFGPKLDLSEHLEQPVRDFARVGDRLYSLHDHGMLVVSDFSDLALPAVTAIAPTAPLAARIAAADGLAVVAYHEAGLGVYDLSDPARPSRIGWLDRTTPAVRRLAVAGGLAFLAEGEAGVTLVDLGDPSMPRVLATLDTPGRAVDLAAAGSLAIVADDSGGLAIINAAEHSAPAVIATVDLGDPVYEVALDGARAFALTTGHGLHALDLTDPRAPHVYAALDPVYGHHIAAAGGRVYLDRSAPLEVLDGRDLSPLGRYPPTDYSYPLEVKIDDLIIEDGFVFSVSEYHGLNVLDARDPARIEAAGRLDTPGLGRGLARWGDHVYVADWHWGLRAYHVPVGPRVHAAYLPVVMATSLGGVLRPLTNRAQIFDQAGSAQPALSPDGRQLVAVVEIYGLTRPALRLVDVESGQQVEIGFQAGLRAIETPTFTPDGRGIIFAGLHVRWDIFRWDLAAERLENLTVHLAAAGQYRRPALSPDGRLLAFDRSDTTEVDGPPVPEDIWIMDLPAGSARRVTDHPALDRFPSFAPDGRRLVFRSEREGQSELYTVGVDGADLERLTDDAAFDGYASYSPDGRWIVFHSTRSGGDDVFLLSLRTRAVHPLTNVEQPLRQPRFAPSGQSVVLSVPGAFVDPRSFWSFSEIFEVETPRGIEP